MDPSQYKDITVHGIHYHYYCSAPKLTSNPTLLFLHGFPSTSEHWVHQVGYFSNKGYGIIAPDMLGYGGTSKPEDPKAYNGPELAAHCIAILDAEGVDKAVIVAHDWGTRVASKLANLYPERHLASIFLVVSYAPPNPDQSGEDIIEFVKKTFGQDLFSYWKFFASEEGPQVLSAHEDSFYDLVFASDPLLLRNHFAPDGELKKWLLGGSRTPVASWAPDRKRHHEIFRAGGWFAPTNWYRGLMQGAVKEADKVIPRHRYKVTHPVLLITAFRDAVLLPSMIKSASAASCTNLTVRELDAGHWIMFEKPDELNTTIDEYLLELKG